MRVSAKRKKLFPVEESADGMGGPSGRVILSLSLPPSFSPYFSYSVNRELARIQSKLLGQTLGHLIPDKGRDRQSRQQNRLEKFPFVPFPLYALPVCSGACGGRWTTSSPCRTIRGFAVNGVDESIRSPNRSFDFSLSFEETSSFATFSFIIDPFFFIGDLRNRTWKRS